MREESRLNGYNSAKYGLRVVKRSGMDDRGKSAPLGRTQQKSSKASYIKKSSNSKSLQSSDVFIQEDDGPSLFLKESKLHLKN
jgi:hypothetical protein